MRNPTGSNCHVCGAWIIFEGLSGEECSIKHGDLPKIVAPRSIWDKTFTLASWTTQVASLLHGVTLDQFVNGVPTTAAAITEGLSERALKEALSDKDLLPESMGALLFGFPQPPTRPRKNRRRH